MSRRPWLVGATFAAAALVLALALTWVTRLTLELERAEVEAVERAVHEENVRIALWRMDAALADFIARENARPGDAFATAPAGAQGGEPPAGSPVAAGRGGGAGTTGSGEGPPAGAAEVAGAGSGAGGEPGPPLVRARFEVGADRSLDVEPQRPAPEWVASLDVPPPRDLPREPVVRVAAAEPPGRHEQEPGARSTPSVPSAPSPASETPGDRDPWSALTSPGVILADRVNVGGNESGSQSSYTQEQLNTLSFEQRQELGSQASRVLPPPSQAETPAAGAPATAPTASEEEAEVPATAPPVSPQAAEAPATALLPPGPPARAPRPPPMVEVQSAFTPRWLGDDLVLLRRAYRGESGLLQGVWLEWEAVEAWLLAQAGDLLPAGDLVPAEGAPDPGRSLALLPARLVPGPMPEVVPPDWTPVRLTLAAAWGAALLALLGVAGLLVGSVRLSQRRADFVSAVSHELRTPLTTFRLYAEMLRDGMVGESDRRSYLETLSGEADRLEHLVGNVLAFSRLERRAGPSRLDSRPLGELLAPAVARLRERAARGGLTLEESVPEALARTPVRADPAAVEQILTNLVDNACKYAAHCRPPVLHLEAEARGRTVVLRVRDHGPGIAPRDRRRLFRPFHKSARHAAETAPGVGLGLALCRRMARAQGGRLRLARTAEGAVFELALRRAGGR